MLVLLCWRKWIWKNNTSRYYFSGLLKPDTGKILLDGKELELCNNGWRRNISYVSQSTYLIDDTIKNNIFLVLIISRANLLT